VDGAARRDTGPLLSTLFPPLVFFLRVGEEAREQAQEGEEGAEVKDVMDAGFVGEVAEDGGSYAPHAEGEAEEEAGDQSDLPGHEFLGIDEDGGEGRGQDDADED